MDQALPVTIQRSIFGQLGIFLGAVASIAVILSGFAIAMMTPGVNQVQLFIIAVFATTVVAAVFIVWLWVYSLSYVTLTADSITAVYWKSLFVKQNAQAEWSDIEEASFVKAGIFSFVFNFGTLKVQTAGTRQDISMTLIPNVEHWQEVAQYLQDNATQ